MLQIFTFPVKGLPQNQVLFVFISVYLQLLITNSKIYNLFGPSSFVQTYVN